MEEGRHGRSGGSLTEGNFSAANLLAASLLATSFLACVETSADPAAPPTGSSVYDGADEGCGVLVCPSSEEPCCTQVLATASDSVSADYAHRNRFIRSLAQSPSEVRADFHFEAADQRGGVLFNLGRERHLATLSARANGTGPIGPTITVTLSDATSSGCVSSFDLAPSADVAAAQAAVADLQEDGFCFSEGTPGSGSSLQFSVFSTAAGDASLTLRRIELRALELPE